MSSALSADEPGQIASLQVVVRRTDLIAPQIMAVELEPTHGPLPTWTPGAHVDIHTPAGWRSYSLCGGLEDPTWLIAVQREVDGRGGSAWVHDHLHAGARLSLRGPRNHFPLVAAERYLFIAGGFGITPLVSMISTVATHGNDWTMMYGARDVHAMAFLEQLKPHGERISIWPQDSHGMLPLDTLLQVEDDVSTAVYCCGPSGLINAVETLCEHENRIDLHTERFQPTTITVSADDSAFEVILACSGRRLRVGPGDKILDVLEAAGVIMAWSCREGLCGTCELAVLAGEPDHRDEVLTPIERARGDRIITCVSRAHTPTLTLDL